MDYLEEENRKRKRFILFFALISIFFHGALVLLLYVFPEYMRGPNLPTPEEEVVWVSPEVLSPAQIADIERPKVEQRPEKARFAGQYDSAVKEESVARPKPPPKVLKENPDSSEEKPSKSSKPSDPSGAQKPVKAQKVAKKKAPPAEQIPQAEDKPEQSPAEKPITRKEPPVEKSPVKYDNEIPKEARDFNLRAEDVYKTKPTKEKQASSTPPRDLSLRNAGSGLSMGRATSPDMFAHDYYPDYKVGGKTYLNVMKLQDVGYFVRMKRILKMRWNPVPPVERYMMSNRITMGKIDCVMALGLDASGNINELFVIRSSGVPGYDQEAMQTIRDSSPFASPPDQYLKDGQLRMSWTFTVYL